MSTRLVNAALVVVAVLLSSLVVYTQSEPTSAELHARKRNLLSVFRAEDVQALRIKGEQRVSVKRGVEPGQWRLTAPINGVAEEASIDQLLRTLHFATWLRKLLPEEVDRELLGLNQPTWVLHIDSKHQNYRLRLGVKAKSPVGAYYLEVTGENVPNKFVYVVPGSLIKDLSLGLSDFRVRRIVPLAEAELRAFKVTQGTRHLDLEQSKVNEWHFKNRFSGARVNREAVDRIFVQLSRTQASDFLTLQVAEQAQRQVAAPMTIELIPHQGETVQLRLAGRCPSDSARTVALRIRPEPLAACVPNDLLTSLMERADAFLDRKVFALRPDEVERLELQPQGKRLELIREGDGFRMRSPLEGKVAPGAGQKRLQALLNLSGEWVEADPALRVFAEGATQVTLGMVASSEAKMRSEIVLISSLQSDGFVYAKRDADGVVLRLAPDTTRLLVVDGGLLRSLDAFELTRGELTRVTIHSTEVAQTLVQSRAGEFELAEPVGYAVDAALATEMFDALRTLRVEEWVQLRDSSQYGISTPVVRVVLHTQDKTWELKIGSRAPSGGYFGALDGAVMRVNAALVRKLQTWAISRSHFLLDQDTLRRLQVWVRTLSGRGSYVLERLGGEFIQTQGKPLPSEKITTLIDALSGLRPSAAINLEGAQRHQGFERPLLEVFASHMEDGVKRDVRWQIGAGDQYQDQSMHYGRLTAGPHKDAVYSLPRQNVLSAIEQF